MGRSIDKNKAFQKAWIKDFENKFIKTIEVQSWARNKMSWRTYKYKKLTGDKKDIIKFIKGVLKAQKQMEIAENDRLHNSMLYNNSRALQGVRIE